MSERSKKKRFAVYRFGHLDICVDEAVYTIFIFRPAKLSYLSRETLCTSFSGKC